MIDRCFLAGAGFTAGFGVGSGVAADAGVAAGALEALAGVTSLFVGVFSFDELTGL